MLLNYFYKLSLNHQTEHDIDVFKFYGVVGLPIYIFKDKELENLIENNNYLKGIRRFLITNVISYIRNKTDTVLETAMNKLVSEKLIEYEKALLIQKGNMTYKATAEEIEIYKEIKNRVLDEMETTPYKVIINPKLKIKFWQQVNKYCLLEHRWTFVKEIVFVNLINIELIDKYKGVDIEHLKEEFRDVLKKSVTKRINNQKYKCLDSIDMKTGEVQFNIFNYDDMEKMIHILQSLI